MANMDQLSVCPRCRGVWLTSTLRNGVCHVCSGQLLAEQRRMKQAKASHVVQRQHVAIPNEANRGIKEARAMHGVLEGEVRRL